MSEQVDLLLVNGTVVTMDADFTVIPHGAVAIRGREIVAAGPTEALAERCHARETVDCADCAIIPGLINGHAHVPMSLLRGLVADVQLDVWLFGYMFPVESRFVDAEFVYHGSRLSCAEMIKSGITTFVDMYFFEEEVARAADESGMRGICGQSVMKLPTPDAPSYDEGLERIADPRIQRHRVGWFCLVNGHGQDGAGADPDLRQFPALLAPAGVTRRQVLDGDLHFSPPASNHPASRSRASAQDSATL